MQKFGRGIQLEVIKLPQAKRDIVLLPQKCVMKRSFARAIHHTSLPHLVVFASLMLYHWISLLSP